MLKIDGARQFKKKYMYNALTTIKERFQYARTKRILNLDWSVTDWNATGKPRCSVGISLPWNMTNRQSHTPGTFSCQEVGRRGEVPEVGRYPRVTSLPRSGKPSGLTANMSLAWPGFRVKRVIFTSGT